MTTIKDIIEKFQNKYLKSLTGNEELKTQDIIDLLLNIERFLSSSLTELLDSIEKETLGKIPFTMKRSRKEVINIINSHR